MPYKIAILCPIIFRQHVATPFKETPFYKNLLHSFLIHYDRNLQYMFFVGIEKVRNTFSNIETQNEIKRLISVMNNVNIEFFHVDAENTSITKMWNTLANHAYQNGFDYFINVCDNFIFNTSNWTQPSIIRLKKNNNIGTVIYYDNKYKHSNVVFVHRKHIDMIGSFFNPDIQNHSCSDWIEKIYPKHHVITIENVDVSTEKKICKLENKILLEKLVKSDKMKLKQQVNYIFQG